MWNTSARMHPSSRRRARRDSEEEIEAMRRPPREAAVTTQQKGRSPFGERKSPVSFRVVKLEQAQTIALRKGAHLQYVQSSAYEAGCVTNAQKAQERARSRSPSPSVRRPPSERVPTSSYQFETDDAFLTRLNKAENADEERSKS